MINKLKEEIMRAKEAVEDLPEPFKSKTYDKLIERILDSSYTEAPAKIKKNTGNRKPVSMKKDETIEKINKALDRSKYPDIHKFKTMERSLYLLDIVHQELGIDGLSPSQISAILTDKFRIKTSQEAVSMALMKSSFVDRVPIVHRGAKAYLYKLMKAGEDHLAKIIQETNTDKNG